MNQLPQATTGTLLEAQKSVLQMIAAGNPLAVILEALCRIVEDQAGEPLQAAILLVDPTGRRLMTGAAPGLPEEYARAIDGIAVDASVGASAAAAARRETVLTPEIANDPGWSLLRHLPPKLGLKAAWSMPIVSSANHILGTLATYFLEERARDPRERQLLEVVARTAALVIERQRSEEHLRGADRRKDEFLATLAHELRGPLAPLRNGLQIARLKSHSDPGLQRTLDMMERQLAHLVRLVDDLMDVGRIGAGKIELRRELVNLADVVASSAERCQSILDQHGHVLEISNDVGAVWVNGDFARLAQIFSNLLANAAKYTTRPGSIRVSISRENSGAVVRVTDSGIGIPPTDLARVFDLFSQVRVHQSHADGGLGIGLALVRTLVTLHQGSVTAHSEGVGQGSTFTVRLPAALRRGAVAASTEAAANSNESGGRRRILIADDNADSVLSLAALLALDGHEVETAHNGLEAVRKAQSFRPDCVILDLGMPGMDGLQAARNIRALGGGEKILLIAVTGWGQASDRDRTHAVGFDYHLVKPLEIDLLKDTLTKAAMQRPRAFN